MMSWTLLQKYASSLKKMARSEELPGQLNIYDFLPDPNKVYELEIRGLCDDAYCPNCGYCFMDHETDIVSCPVCHIRVDWTRWHRINDE